MRLIEQPYEAVHFGGQCDPDGGLETQCGQGPGALQRITIAQPVIQNVPTVGDRSHTVPNRFTRVPSIPVPELPRPALWLIPVADAFMIVMLSRPRSGSLRTTWVTPGTLMLALCLVPACLAMAGFALWDGLVHHTGIGDVLAILFLLAAVASASLTIVGLGQRLAMRRT